ncbi:MAG: MerR family transcriptional regulator [Candidatus Scalindua sp.]|nr:MerR family transcriptional regulator [Candidatus Scalindua sp.]
MGRVLTSRDICRELGILPYKLQYMFNTGKIREVERTSSGWRVYTKNDVKAIKKALFKEKAR